MQKTQIRPTAYQTHSNKHTKTFKQHAKNNFFCDAAEGIAKQATQNLSHANRSFLQTGLGKPTTIVPLPNGTRMDTRITLQNSDAHSKNNRLGATEGEAKAHEGMKSKRDIDFSNPCPPFLQAAAKRTMISPSPHVAKRAATAMDVTKHKKNYCDLCRKNNIVLFQLRNVPLNRKTYTMIEVVSGLEIGFKV